MEMDNLKDEYAAVADAMQHSNGISEAIHSFMATNCCRVSESVYFSFRLESHQTNAPKPDFTYQAS
jgi:hypothetical protein